MSLDYSHCLRPYYTQELFEMMDGETQLNPFGLTGTGKKRLLDDLMDIARQAGIPSVRMNMKAHANSFASFLRQAEIDLSRLSSSRKTIVPLMAGKMDLPKEQLPSLSVLLNHTCVNTKDKLFLFLEQFDKLIDPNIHDFPMSFFDDLNYIKHNTAAVLCCTTCFTHIGSTLSSKEEQIVRTSFLELIPNDIPELTIEEIRRVVERKLTQNEQWNSITDKEFYYYNISETDAPIIFLNLLKEDFNSPRFNPRLSAPKRFEKYQKQYKKRYQPSKK